MAPDVPTPKKTRARKAAPRRKKATRKKATRRKRKPAGPKPGPWDGPPWVRPFLEYLGDLQDVKAAVAAVNKADDDLHLNRCTPYEHRERHEKFAAVWDQLLEHRGEDLANSAWKRATDGHLRPIYHRGIRVGFERVYETGLSIFLLRTACGFTTPREAAGGARGTAQAHAEKVVEALAAIESLEGREEPPPHEVEAPAEKAPV